MFDIPTTCRCSPGLGGDSDCPFHSSDPYYGNEPANYSIWDKPDRNPTLMTPAEQLKAQIVPAAAALKAKIEAEQARLAAIEAERLRKQDREATEEAVKVFAEAKAAMLRELKLVWSPDRNMTELGAEKLIDLAKPEGFQVEKLYPEWGWCGVRIKIP